MEFDLGQPATQIAAAILFLVPGLNATWFLERLRGPSRLKGTERLLRALSLSLLIYAGASPWLVAVGRRVLDLRPVSPWELILGGFVVLFIAPLLLALVAALLGMSSRAKWLLGLVATIDPTPRAWDYAFKGERPFFVRINSGTGSESAASSVRTPSRPRIPSQRTSSWKRSGGSDRTAPSLSPSKERRGCSCLRPASN